MIPGTTTKLTESVVASAATISAKTDIVILTGSVGVNTILPNFGGGQFSGILFLVTQGAVVLGTSGNIAVGATTVVNRVTILIWSKLTAKWYIQTVV